MLSLLRSLCLTVLAFSFMTSVLSPARVFAADPNNCTTSFLGIPTWYAYLNLDSECRPLNSAGSPIEGIDDLAGAIPNVVIAVVDALLRVSGVVAFVFVVASGFRFVFAQGDPGKEKSARTALFNAIIGAVIATLAAFIVSFIGGRLT